MGHSYRFVTKFLCVKLNFIQGAEECSISQMQESQVILKTAWSYIEPRSRDSWFWKRYSKSIPSPPFYSYVSPGFTPRTRKGAHSKGFFLIHRVFCFLFFKHISYRLCRSLCPGCPTVIADVKEVNNDTDSKLFWVGKLY